MSGHSKWAQIKRKKGVTDVKRGKLFSQLTKAITVAARTEQNLDMAVSRAKAANMPADTIERAIKKGTGELSDGTQIESLTYEAYGPGGAGLLIGVLTDNRNRTLSELKAVLNRHGGRLADSGSVQYQFERKGLIEVAVPTNVNRDEVILSLIEAGAQDIEDHHDGLSVYTRSNELALVRSAVAALEVSIVDTKYTNVPKLIIQLADDDAGKILTLMEAIDELDDVESVETTASLTGDN